MIKVVCKFVILLLMLSSCSSKKKIVEPTDRGGNSNVSLLTSFTVSKDLTASVNDFKFLLTSVANDRNKINVLITDDLSGIENSDIIRKVKNNRQAYYLESNDGQLTVYAIHPLGAQYGLYGYLKKLGFKWYFPGKNWMISPRKKSWYTEVSEFDRPDFRGRRFFGGGGYPRKHVADPNNNVMTSWEEWQRRNRFGADYYSKGHAWQDFIRRNKTIIDQNPEYVSESGKQLCVTNKGLQKLFIEDRIKRVEENRKRYGVQDPRALTIGVEPNDGGEHCNCTECNKLGSISNKVFFLANVTAKAIKERYSQIKVSVMAYNEHAATPDFALEKNIQVSVVPYAYQDVAAPEELLRAWSEKHHDIQVRDYWGVVIWTKAYPVKNFMNLTQNRIKTWDKLGVDMMMVESSYSIGMAGVPLYLMSQMGWDKSYNADQGLKAMFLDLFGVKAGPVMQSMLQRWSDNGLNITFERHLTPQDLKTAYSSANTDLQKERVASFEDYFNFLLLQENVRATKANTAERRKELSELLDYSYSIMDGLMLHSYWMPSPMSRLYDRKNYDARKVRTVEKNRGQAYYQNLSKNDYTQKRSKPDKDITQSLIKAMPSKGKSSDSNLIDDIPNKERLIKTGKSFVFRHDADVSSEYYFDIEVTQRTKSIKKNATIVSLYNSDGEVVSSKRYLPGKKYIGERIKIAKKGKYEIRFRSSNVTAEILWKKSRGIELVPGTLVDFGEYYIISTENTVFVKKDSRTLNYLNSKNIPLVMHGDIIKIDNADHTNIRIESNIVVSTLSNRVTINL